MQSNNEITEVWNSLVAVALLGTERRTATLPSLAAPLGSLLAQIGENADSARPEQAFLGAATLLSAYKRAGQQRPAVSMEPPPTPCELEERLYCTPDAAGHLSLMLNGQYADVLPEWLSLLVKRGKLVPPEQIADLLDLGKKQEHLRGDIQLSTGRRGQWLSIQNPQWDYLVPNEADPDTWQATWETGNSGTRRALLGKVRRVEPARARALISSTWKEDKAAERCAFITILSEALSIEDEPILEIALDDRSKDVREKAAELLSQVPGSGLMYRMVEGVLPLVSYKEIRHRKLFGGTTDKSYIDIALPEEYTAQMKRDGIEQKAPHTRLGERAYWLSQILGRIPPALWCERWGVPPGAILAATQNSKEWRDLLMGAWAEAARRHKDVQWVRALLVHSQNDSMVEDIALRLLWVLPAQEREEHAIAILKRNHAALYTAAMPVALLWQLESPWSMELSRLVLRSAAHYIAEVSTLGGWEVRESLQGFARLMPPAILEEATASLFGKASANIYFTVAVDEFLATIRFRRDMLKELD